MTKDRLKKRLHGYIDRKHELEQIDRQIEQLRATIEAPRSQAMDGMPKGSGGGDAMAAIVAELVDLQRKYEAKRLQLVQAQKEVEDLIDSLEPLERRLMRCRYIEGKFWEEVCVELNYSWAQVHRHHSEALNKLVEAETPKPEPKEPKVIGKVLSVDVDKDGWGLTVLVKKTDATGEEVAE